MIQELDANILELEPGKIILKYAIIGFDEVEHKETSRGKAYFADVITLGGKVRLEFDCKNEARDASDVLLRIIKENRAMWNKVHRFVIEAKHDITF